MALIAIITAVLIAASVGGSLMAARRDGYHRIADQMDTSTLEARHLADLTRKER